MTAPHIDLDQLDDPKAEQEHVAILGWVGNRKALISASGHNLWEKPVGTKVYIAPFVRTVPVDGHQVNAAKAHARLHDQIAPEVIEQTFYAGIAWEKAQSAAKEARVAEIEERLRRAEARAAAAETEGYRLGLTRAGNMKPSVTFYSEGANVLNDIRSQIDAELAHLPDPNDPLDDVLPLRPLRMPDNLPKSIDLDDKEGGNG